jgi:ribosome biogenesis protein Tsr3
MHWSVDRKDQDATSQDAMKFAAPGKLAIVYGSPESVDEDGTIVLRYRYARIISPKHFTANEVNYGRPGESYHPASYQPRFAASSPSP